MDELSEQSQPAAGPAAAPGAAPPPASSTEPPGRDGGQPCATSQAVEGLGPPCAPLEPPPVPQTSAEALAAPVLDAALALIPPQHPGGRRLTPEARAQFLTALAQTGSFAAAARSLGGTFRRRYQSFRRLYNINPTFRAECEEAIQLCLGRCEREAIRRAVEGVDKGIYYKGQRVGSERQFSDALLLKVLAVLAPDRWGERKITEHTGTVKVEGEIAFKPEQILKLPQEKRSLLIEIVEEMERKAK